MVLGEKHGTNYLPYTLLLFVSSKISSKREWVTTKES